MSAVLGTRSWSNYSSSVNIIYLFTDCQELIKIHRKGLISFLGLQTTDSSETDQQDYDFLYKIFLKQLQKRFMKAVLIDQVVPVIRAGNDEVPMFDGDNWDFGKDDASEKSIRSVAKTQRSIVNHIDAQIKATKEGFLKTGLLKQCKSGSRGINLAKMSNPHHILKEGYLRKKTNGFFYSWTERYVVLTPQKLIWFQNETKFKAIGCVNLRLLKAQLKLTEGDIILDFNRECENLIFHAENQKDAEAWIEVLSVVVNYQGKVDKLMLKTQSKFFYEHKDILTEKEFLTEAETGDILLFYTDHFSAKLQRFFTNSDFDHIAMVVKLRNKDLMVFESNQMHGVSVYDWKQYISYFDLYGKVTLRKLQYVRKAEAQASLLKFVKKNLGKKYEISALKLLKFESDFNWEAVNEDRGYFCSELIGKALKSIGLLDEKKSSGRYWPVDFAEESGMQLLRGASLGPEQSVILEKHIKNSMT